MGIEEMKTMKTQLMSCIQGQMGDLSKTDTHELGEAIDMVKDLSEAIYYCTITESMEKSDEMKMGNNTVNYYTMPAYRDMERTGGYMYYPTGGGQGQGQGSSSMGTSGGNGSTSYYTEFPYSAMRDPREGRAPMRRRMYMEGKEQHKDTTSQLHELQAYLEELTNDITEMVEDASREEKTTLREKMMSLANKIA